MTRSRYLERFQALVSESGEAYELIGDIILVEKLKEPERKIGSIIIADSKHAKSSMGEDTRPRAVLVLAVGKGYYDAEGKDVPLDVSPGDIIFISPHSVQFFSTFGDLADYEPDTIGISRASEIHVRFKQEAGYASSFEVLNRYARKTTV